MVKLRLSRGLCPATSRKASGLRRARGVQEATSHCSRSRQCRSCRECSHPRPCCLSLRSRRRRRCPSSLAAAFWRRRRCPLVTACYALQFSSELEEPARRRGTPMALGGAAARSAGRPSSSHLWQEPSLLSRMQELSVRMQRRARATGRAVRQVWRAVTGQSAARFFGADFGSYVVNFSPRVIPATRPPGAPRDHGSPSQALWVGGDRTWPPCPRSDRSRSAHCGVRRAVGGGKRAASRMSSSYMTCSTSVFRAAREG